MLVASKAWLEITKFLTCFLSYFVNQVWLPKLLKITKFVDICSHNSCFLMSKSFLMVVSL